MSILDTATVRDLVSITVSEMAPALPSLQSMAKYSCKSFSPETGQAADIPRPECPARSNHSLKRNRKCARRLDQSALAGLTNCPVQSKTPFPVRNPCSWLVRKLASAHLAV